MVTKFGCSINSLQNQIVIIVKCLVATVAWLTLLWNLRKALLASHKMFYKPISIGKIYSYTTVVTKPFAKAVFTVERVYSKIYFLHWNKLRDIVNTKFHMEEMPENRAELSGCNITSCTIQPEENPMRSYIKLLCRIWHANRQFWVCKTSVVNSLKVCGCAV